MAVSDGTDCILAKIYDEGKFNKVQVGTCLALRDVIRKIDDMRHIVLTKNTKAFITAVFSVPDGHTAIGDSLVDPPAAAIGTPIPPEDQGVCVGEDRSGMDFFLIL